MKTIMVIYASNHQLFLFPSQIDDHYRRKSRFAKKFVKAKVKRFRLVWIVPLLTYDCLLVCLNFLQNTKAHNDLTYVRKGSVLADVDLTFADDATDITPDALKSDLPTSGEMGNMSYNPSNAAVGGWFRVLAFYPIKMTSENICGTHILPRVYYVNYGQTGESWI